MKKVLQRSGMLKWLDQTANRRERKNYTYVVPRSLYKEHRRSYKANVVELLRLIRNESRVYARPGNTVVWRCRQLAHNHYTVQYAVLDLRANDLLAKGWQILLPETWLLYALLEENTLYRVHSGEDYWAWLKPDQMLQITSIKGLMQQPQYFLDAIGVPASEVQTEVLDFRSLHALPKGALSAIDYLGLSVLHQPVARAKQAFPWRQLGILSGALLAIYAGLLSAGLVYQEQSLNEQVAQFQKQANEVFVRQRELEEQMSVLNSYQNYFQRFPGTSLILAQLAEQLQGVAIIRTIQASGPLVQISGTADSATEVFSILTAQDMWQEVKFDRNIQRSKDQEVFTISMVYKKPPNQQQTKLEPTNHGLDQEGSSQ